MKVLCVPLLFWNKSNELYFIRNVFLEEQLSVWKLQVKLTFKGIPHLKSEIFRKSDYTHTTKARAFKASLMELNCFLIFWFI